MKVSLWSYVFKNTAEDLQPGQERAAAPGEGIDHRVRPGAAPFGSGYPTTVCRMAAYSRSRTWSPGQPATRRAAVQGDDLSQPRQGNGQESSPTAC